MSIVQVIILSIIEGVTEFLPVSSTGHLILASHLLKIQPTEFSKSFEIVIQLGAVMAVGTLYAKKILKNPFMLIPALIAFVPTALVGFLFYPLIKGYFLEQTTVTIISLFAGGIAIIVFEQYYSRLPNNKSTTKKSWLTSPGNRYRSAFIRDIFNRSIIIGLFQSVSINPGISRSAASIVGGMVTGLSRTAAVEFSFLLSLPTIAAAAGYDLVKTGASFSSQEWLLLSTGFIISWIVAIIAIKQFISFVSTNTLVPFGTYRIILAISFVLVQIFSI